jgi:hypothetical protein
MVGAKVLSYISGLLKWVVHQIFNKHFISLSAENSDMQHIAATTMKIIIFDRKVYLKNGK